MMYDRQPLPPVNQNQLSPALTSAMQGQRMANALQPQQPQQQQPGFSGSGQQPWITYASLMRSAMPGVKHIQSQAAHGQRQVPVPGQQPVPGVWSGQQPNPWGPGQQPPPWQY